MSAESWKKEFYPVDARKVSKEKAIKHSLVKWYGLRKENLKKHGLMEPPIGVGSDSCSLCNNYSYCRKGCPLYDFKGETCGFSNHYGAYIIKGNPEPMIAALEAISFVEDVCK